MAKHEDSRPPAPAHPANKGTLPLRFGPDAEDIQGDTIAGFNKDHRIYFFLQFPDGDHARSWLGELMDEGQPAPVGHSSHTARPRISSVKAVAAFNDAFSAARHQRGGDDPENMKALWINVSFTFSGLTTLGPALADGLRTYPTASATTSEDDLNRKGWQAFIEGPAPRAEAVGDVGASTPENWIIGNPQQQIDALLWVAADDPDDLLTEASKLRALAAKYGLLTIYEQRGETLPAPGTGHEHFGFKDGVSQPGVEGFSCPDPVDPEQVKDHLGSDIIGAGEFLMGYSRQKLDGTDDDAPPPPPRPFLPWMHNGSFQVFRRLAQDVPGFWAQVIANHRKMALPSDDPTTPEVLAAKLVGRWRSGTPLDLSPEVDDRFSPGLIAPDHRPKHNGHSTPHPVQFPADDNNFEFLGKDDEHHDDAGHRCPRFAHIRKVYPRIEELNDERRRIIRRGIPFGLPFDPASGAGHGVDADRGLLFVAFMSDIEEQFEFLQKNWANTPTFPERDSGPDPIIGDHQPRPSPVGLKLAAAGGGDVPLPAPLDFARFVHTTGALYAFAPSLTTLRELALGQHK